MLNIRIMENVTSQNIQYLAVADAVFVTYDVTSLQLHFYSPRADLSAYHNICVPLSTQVGVLFTLLAVINTRNFPVAANLKNIWQSGTD